MKMRELELATGVNRETIRVYLRYGLLPAPQRDKPNVADYDDSHVEGVRTIRRLQKEQGLTLPQIRAALAGGSADMPLRAGAFPHLAQLLAGRVPEADALVPLGALRARNPRVSADATALAKIGAIELQRHRGQPAVSRLDAELLGIWGAMRAAGFSEANGFGPQVLRFYVECANELARREVTEFLDIVTGRLGDAEAAQLALEALTRMLPFFGLLRTKAVLREMHSNTQPRPARPATKSPPRR